MNLNSYYRSMFFIGALWNWGAAILFFFAFKPIFVWLGMKELDHPLIIQAYLLLVFVFGIGYFWVSRDLNKNLHQPVAQISYRLILSTSLPNEMKCRILLQNVSSKIS